MLTLLGLTAAWTALLAAGSEICRRGRLLVVLVFWAVLPFALLPHWLDVGRETWTWFLWAKTYSVTTALVWLMVCRVWPKKLPTGAIRWPLYLFLVLNILEAVALDFVGGHWLNAVAGALLALTVAGPSSIAVEPDGRRDLTFDLGAYWVVAYTVWNFVFVYSNWGGLVMGQHAAVLGAALLIAVWTGWERWFQARAFTLGLHVLVYDSFFFQMRAEFNTTSLYNEPVRDGLQAVGLLVVMVLLGVRALRARRSAGRG